MTMPLVGRHQATYCRCPPAHGPRGQCRVDRAIPADRPRDSGVAGDAGLAQQGHRVAARDLRATFRKKGSCTKLLCWVALPKPSWIRQLFNRPLNKWTCSPKHTIANAGKDRELGASKAASPKQPSAKALVQ